MCLVVFAWRTHKTYPLLLIGNRDEMHARPTAPLAWWQTAPILGGRDLSAGGTWLATDGTGRFGAITNFREATASKAGGKTMPSRGELIPQFLAEKDSPLEFLNRLKARAQHYAGFSIVIGNRSELAFYCNRDGQDPAILEPGIYGLSNSTLNVPWPKVSASRQRLSDAIHQPFADPLELTDLLSDRKPVTDELLPKTGLALSLERRLSPAFIVDTAYGTRSTSVLLLGQNDSYGDLVIERSYAPDGAVQQTVRVNI